MDRVSEIEFRMSVHFNSKRAVSRSNLQQRIPLLSLLSILIQALYEYICTDDLMLLPCKLCNANDRIVVSLDETKNEARAVKTVFSRVTTRLIRLESTHDSLQYL